MCSSAPIAYEAAAIDTHSGLVAWPDGLGIGWILLRRNPLCLLAIDVMIPQTGGHAVVFGVLHSEPVEQDAGTDQ